MMLWNYHIYITRMSISDKFISQTSCNVITSSYLLSLNHLNKLLVIRWLGWLSQWKDTEKQLNKEYRKEHASLHHQAMVKRQGRKTIIIWWVHIGDVSTIQAIPKETPSTPGIWFVTCAVTIRGEKGSGAVLHRAPVLGCLWLWLLYAAHELCPELGPESFSSPRWGVSRPARLKEPHDNEGELFVLLLLLARRLVYVHIV